MQTNQTNTNEPTNDSSQIGRVTPCAPPGETNDSPQSAAGRGLPALPHRRRFLQVAGAALLAGAALPKSAQAGISVTVQLEHSSYSLGLVGKGAVALQVYLATGADGTGFGTLSDVLHPALASHLSIERSGREGNQVRYEGRVSASNSPALVGLAFTVDGRVQNELTDLSLTLGQDTFTGKGLHVGWIDPGTMPSH